MERVVSYRVSPEFRESCRLLRVLFAYGSHLLKDSDVLYFKDVHKATGHIVDSVNYPTAIVIGLCKSLRAFQGIPLEILERFADPSETQIFRKVISRVIYEIEKDAKVIKEGVKCTIWESITLELGYLSDSLLQDVSHSLTGIQLDDLNTLLDYFKGFPKDVPNKYFEKLYDLVSDLLEDLRRKDFEGLNYGTAKVFEESLQRILNLLDFLKFPEEILKP